MRIVGIEVSKKVSRNADQMIDIKQLRDSPEAVKAALVRRDAALEGAASHLLELDARRRALLTEVEHLKADRNRSSEEVARRKKENVDASDLLVELKSLSARIKDIDLDVRSVEADLDGAILQVPNLPLEELPDGGADDFRIIRTWGEPTELDFEARPHWDLGESLGILDLPRGAAIAGSGFPLFLGMGARLVRSLVNQMLDIHVQEHGYIEVAPPLLVNEDSARGTGQLPDLEDNMYVTKDGLYLVPTAEVPVTNINKNSILDAETLPKAFVAYTPCFRREAGAHGRDTRGIIRVHQFDKVELVRLCKPEDSRAELEKLLGHAEAVLQRLGIPYRVIMLAAGDIGFASAMTYDIEVWAAGVQKWLEVSSASTFTDFQARRAGIRYRPEPQAKPDYVHTLNASGLALPRTIIPLLENNQQPDGSVKIPESLAGYLGTDLLTPHGAA